LARLKVIQLISPQMTLFGTKHLLANGGFLVPNLKNPILAPCLEADLRF
jgi:hypothetical protein